MVYSDVGHRAARHSRMTRFVGILNYSNPTHSLDGLHSGCAIVEVAGEYDGNHPATV